MIYLETNQIYYNTRPAFRQKMLDTLPNNEKDWYYAYRSWLREQGCEIVRKGLKNILAVDQLGVAPGYDQFAFENEEDATVFLLRWS